MAPASRRRQLSGHELDDERRPAALSRRGSQVSALRARKSACDGETETRAANVRHTPGGAIERLEDPVGIVRRNSTAAVGHEDAESVTALAYYELDRRLGGRIL